MESDYTISQQQQAPGRDVPIPMRLDASNATPVYGSAQPSAGVPEQMRRQAYSYPAHDARRWMTLLAADRAESAGHVAQEMVTPGQQIKVVRHVARQARAHPEGYVAGAGVLVFGCLLWALARRVSRSA